MGLKAISLIIFQFYGNDVCLWKFEIQMFLEEKELLNVVFEYGVVLNS
jgi:hypothetical protein